MNCSAKISNVCVFSANARFEVRYYCSVYAYIYIGKQNISRTVSNRDLQLSKGARMRHVAFGYDRKNFWLFFDHLIGYVGYLTIRFCMSKKVKRVELSFTL